MARAHGVFSEMPSRNRTLGDGGTIFSNLLVLGGYNNSKWPAGTRRNRTDNWLNVRRSSILFDCVAVYLAYATELCRMETLKLVVTDDGVAAISEEESANEVTCAVDWVDLPAFHTHLVERISGVDETSMPKV